MILTFPKKILDKLIYSDKYKDIDKRMTDSNIRARRDRSIKNHLFITGKEDFIYTQIYN